MAKKDPTLKERMLFLVSPEKANKAYNRRMNEQDAGKENRQGKRGGSGSPRMNYGNHGASQTLNSMVGWIVNGGAAEDEIDEHGSTLRQRSRDLFDGGGLARSGPLTLTTSVIGWGIHPRPQIDGDYLGMSEEVREETERAILREWKLWAENHFCDAERHKNFYELQDLAFLSMLVSGDVFALFSMKPNKRTPYQLTVRLLEADRICTPDSSGDSEIKNLDGGGRIIDGVEINREGEVVKYHIANHHPLAGSVTEQLEWNSIDAYGSATGEPNILHIMVSERPEQRRGVPFVAAEIELLKQLDRYLKSELTANLVASMFSVFLESTEDDGVSGLEDVVNEDERVTDDDYHYELGPGVVLDLPYGKHVHEVNPTRNNSTFDKYVSAMETVLGSSMTIPKEVLVKKYESNYTAARAALLDFWRTVRVYRTRFNASFNQPIYEQFLSEAVATGRIEAPGFFDDPMIRQAWCGCNWMGASMGHVDPLKEVNAAAMRIAQNITTQEQEASEYNGNDWAANVRQRKRELETLQEFADLVNKTKNQPSAPDDEEDEDEPEEKEDEE